ncbi:hypothetical protein NRS6084_03869 [Bacillus subtilis]|uniref:hypothetical protein n=1 Tax=Bacillus TaxID=1386 RepID=UPI0018E93442|nr:MULTISPECIES: hypothetical protein [Bacillus subtilis group]MBJ3766988.1 hypothetical protein [Bacillus subtilis]MCY7683121.1 hypothetical protein [Bacillus velezensis]MDI6685455.1 hypothetical protein [Bacillus subtilis]CAF1772080.1 hypothetical protein NRS6084_03869 [Bacillus subtilis]
MPFTKELPEWGNAGQRPPQSSIDEGYKPMDHPPADWFNWYQYTAYHALKELQEIAATQDDVSTALKTAKAYTDEFAARRDNPNQVTKAQVGLGNVDNVQQATKTEFNAHNTDSIRHITVTERSNWNAKETTTGAQNKADTAEKNAKTYTDQHINDKSNPHGVTKDQVGLSKVTNDKQATKTEFDDHVKDTTAHITASERTKWNEAQLSKITNDGGGVLISIADTDDFLSKIVETGKTFGTFYSTGKPTNAPSTLSTRGFFHFTSVDSHGKGTFGYVVAIDYKNNVFTNYLDLNQGWAGWSKVETEARAKSYTDNLEKKLTELTWFSPVLQNNWVNYTDVNETDQTKFKVRYAKDITGTVIVEGAIAKGTIGFGVPAFVLPVGYRPARAIQWVGVASQGGMSGIPQTHRLLVNTDGKVIIENCTNTVKPNVFISLGFSFKAV